MKLNQKQIEALRLLRLWKKEEEMALWKLGKARNEHENSITECEKLNIPLEIAYLITSDRNGSGVLEILKESGIEIDVESI